MEKEVIKLESQINLLTEDDEEEFYYEDEDQDKDEDLGPNQDLNKNPVLLDPDEDKDSWGLIALINIFIFAFYYKLYFFLP